MDSDQRYMSLTLRLSLKANGLTHPNPLVGAVIVKNKKVVSKGFHKRAGLEHAEIVALKRAGNKAKGATLYVTLEPCCSFGRTPPCTDAIIKSGIKKVVIGMLDPNPNHNGRAVKILKDHNIEVISNVLHSRIREINQAFIKYITKKMPYLTLKIAQSLDGKIAIKTGESKWITSIDARRFAHKLRNDYDAVMVGINTVLKDDPSLSPTLKIKRNRFYKIVLDTNLRIKSRLKIFKDVSYFPVIIAAKKESILRKSHKIKLLTQRGAIILGINTKDAFLDLGDLLKKLDLFEITNVLVEGGATLSGSLSDDKLIDYVMFFISPRIIGGKDSLSSIQGKGVNRIIDTQEIKNIKIRNIGRDLLIEGAIREY